MEVLFRQIPLNRISTNFTINATASIILAMYYALAEKQGVGPEEIRGTVQNDMIKEFLARNTYIFPVEPSLKVVTDIIEFCAETLPHFNAISIAGYHIREAGSDAVQELALTLNAGIVYVEKVLERGMGVDDFASRLSSSFLFRTRFLRRDRQVPRRPEMWAEIMRSASARG